MSAISDKTPRLINAPVCGAVCFFAPSLFYYINKNVFIISQMADGLHIYMAYAYAYMHIYIYDIYVYLFQEQYNIITREHTRRG